MMNSPTAPSITLAILLRFVFVLSAVNLSTESTPLHIINNIDNRIRSFGPSSFSKSSAELAELIKDKKTATISEDNYYSGGNVVFLDKYFSEDKEQAMRNYFILEAEVEALRDLHNACQGANWNWNREYGEA